MHTNTFRINSDFLACGICSESYDTNVHKPIVLSCGHTLCGRCIQKLEVNSQALQNIKPGNQKEIFNCPYDTKKVSSVNPNYSLMNIATDDSPSNERNHQRIPDSQQSSPTANTAPNDSDINSNSESTLQCTGSHDLVVSSQPRRSPPVEANDNEVMLKNNRSSEPPEAMVIDESDRKAYAKHIKQITMGMVVRSSSCSTCTFLVSAGIKAAVLPCIDKPLALTCLGPPVTLGLSSTGTMFSVLAGTYMVLGQMCYVYSKPVNQEWFILFITRKNQELFKKHDPSDEDISQLEALVEERTHAINNNIDMVVSQMIETEQYLRFPLSNECLSPCETIESRSSYFRKEITNEGIKTLTSCLENSKRKHQETRNREVGCAQKVLAWAKNHSLSTLP